MNTLSSTTALQLLPILLSKHSLYDSVHSIRSVLVTHVVQTHLHGNVGLPTTTADFQLIEQSLLKLITVVIPLIIKTTANQDVEITFTRVAILLCCSSCKKIPILLGKQGLFKKNTKQLAKQGMKILNRSLSTFHTLLLNAFSNYETKEEEGEAKMTLPLIDYIEAMPLLLQGGSREMCKLFSKEWPSGWCSTTTTNDESEKETENTKETEKKGTAALLKMCQISKSAASKTTAALRLIGCYLERNVMDMEMIPILLEMCVGCVCYSNFVGLYELFGRKKKNQNKKHGETKTSASNSAASSASSSTFSGVPLKGIPMELIRALVLTLIYGAVFKATQGNSQMTYDVLQLLIQEENKEKESNDLMNEIEFLHLNKLWCRGKKQTYRHEFIRPNVKTILKLATEIGNGIETELIVKTIEMNYVVELCNDKCYAQAMEYSEGKQYLIQMIRTLKTENRLEVLQNRFGMKVPIELLKVEEEEGDGERKEMMDDGAYESGVEEEKV